MDSLAVYSFSYMNPSASATLAYPPSSATPVCMFSQFFTALPRCIFVPASATSLSRLGTHYLCRSSEGLDDGLELEVIDEEEEMSDGKAGEAEDDGSKVG
jgi:hypothetical protein